MYNDELRKKCIAIILLLLSMAMTIVAITAIISAFGSIRYALVDTDLMNSIALKSGTIGIIASALSPTFFGWAKREWDESE